jgi:hypothetical protein
VRAKVELGIAAIELALDPKTLLHNAITCIGDADVCGGQNFLEAIDASLDLALLLLGSVIATVLL